MAGAPLSMAGAPKIRSGGLIGSVKRKRSFCLILHCSRSSNPIPSLLNATGSSYSR